MNNMQKYADELQEYGTEFGIDKYNNHIHNCCSKDKNCKSCIFHATHCATEIKLKWLFQENTERMHIKITQIEYEIAKYLLSQNYRWIARNSKGSLIAYENYALKTETGWAVLNPTKTYPFASLNPFRELFQFVKWSDSEPMALREITKFEIIDK